MNMSTFGFEIALNLLKQGKKVSRLGWNGKRMWLELQTPTELSKMRQPYIFIVPVGGELVPWVASQPDLLENDWFEFADSSVVDINTTGETPVVHNSRTQG